MTTPFATRQQPTSHRHPNLLKRYIFSKKKEKRRTTYLLWISLICYIIPTVSHISFISMNISVQDNGPFPQDTEFYHLLRAQIGCAITLISREQNSTLGEWMKSYLFPEFYQEFLAIWKWNPSSCTFMELWNIGLLLIVNLIINAIQVWMFPFYLPTDCCSVQDWEQQGTSANTGSPLGALQGLH